MWALRVLDENKGNKSATARQLTDEGWKLDPRTIPNILKRADERGLKYTKPPIELPEFPEDDIPTEQIIDTLVRRNRRRREHHAAKKWFRINVNIDGPFGIMWYGDPHLGSNGCNWELLMEHVGLHKLCEYLLGAGLGDYGDNWTGRLLRLWAESDSSRETERKLTKWFLLESGVPWWLWIFGNHDEWNEGTAILKEMNANKIVMEKRAQFILACPNGHEYRIWVEHDFPGHSMWNTMHGAQKAAHMKEPADLYICGHKHNWGLHQEESASKEFVYWLARARGYKFLDDHAEDMGHQPQMEGASILSVHDPYAKSMAGRLQCYADPEEGTEFLLWKRKRWEAK